MRWGEAGIPRKCAGNAMAVDMLGFRKALEVTDGMANLEIGPCPVYIVGSD